MNFLKGKKIVNWGLAAIALTAVIWFSINYSYANASESTPGNEAAVVSINMAETIDASGSLEAEPFASLNWKTAGTVAAVNVQPGDMVKAGDVLMTLQDTSASASIVASKADLEAAQDKLDELTNPDGGSIGSARENLSNAYANWDKSREDLMNKLSSSNDNGDSDLYNDVTDARDDLDNAQDDFALAANTDAQMYYWAARMDSLGNTGDFDFSALKITLRAKMDNDDANLVDDILDAQAVFEKSVYEYAETVDNQDDAITVMKAVALYEKSAGELLDASQGAYEVLVAPSDEALATARANVDAAQASVNTLSIVAPFDGQVLSVEHRVGDVVTTGELSVNIADLRNLRVQAQVDESDVVRVKVGNQVQVTLDALPGVELSGSVESINPVGEISSGLIKFSVLIALNPVDDEIVVPLGATADSVIQVREATEVLAVPLVAVQNDDQGEYVLVMQSNGVATRVAIESSTIEGDFVVVTGNLKVGDILQIVHDNDIQAAGPLSGGNK